MAETLVLKLCDGSQVKPGLPYLDIIRLLRDSSPLPIAAYQVNLFMNDLLISLFHSRTESLFSPYPILSFETTFYLKLYARQEYGKGFSGCYKCYCFL